MPDDRCDMLCQSVESLFCAVIEQVTQFVRIIGKFFYDQVLNIGMDAFFGNIILNESLVALRITQDDAAVNGEMLVVGYRLAA